MQQAPESFISLLSSHLDSFASTALENLGIGPLSPIADLGVEPATWQVYVLYAPSGMPIGSGVLSPGDDRDELERRMDGLEAAQAVGYYRTIAAGNEALAMKLHMIFRELFGAILPIGESRTAKAPIVEQTSNGSEPARRGPGRPKKESVAVEAPAAEPTTPKRRPGRPRKEPAVAEVPLPPAEVDDPSDETNDDESANGVQTTTNGNGSSSHASSINDSDFELSETGLPLTKNQRRELRRREMALKRPGNEGLAG